MEGPDGSGKSTLIRKYLPDAIHNGGPPKTSGELRARLYGLEAGSTYDRWTAISEQVYGPIIRGRSLIPKREFTEAIRQIQPIVIYCRPPASVLFQNLSKQAIKPHKSSDFIVNVIKHANEIREAYDKLVLKELPALGCLVLNYDYTRELE